MATRFKTKTLATTLTAAGAIFMATMSVAWACGNMTAADMKLENVGGNWPGKNYTYCTIGQMLAPTHTTPCVQTVSVKGTNFQNNIAPTTISQVTLYWLDEPYYAAGLGGPEGAAEQRESDVCQTKGVFLGTASVAVDKTFSTTVTVPPTNPTSADGTPRVGARLDPSTLPTVSYVPNSGKFTWGLNAICAVWDHTVSGITHQGSIGNGYNVWF